MSHDSRGHTGKRKDSAHDDYLDANKDKPQCDNSTKDKYWMKWCDPVTFKAKDTPGWGRGSEINPLIRTNHNNTNHLYVFIIIPSRANM